VLHSQSAGLTCEGIRSDPLVLPQDLSEAAQRRLLAALREEIDRRGTASGEQLRVVREREEEGGGRNLSRQRVELMTAGDPRVVELCKPESE